jgi:PDDEXK-like domain of unknown function (DUF3799)
VTAVISTPGVHYDLDEADYHAQTDWLSVSGAKKLLPPSCPAVFRYDQLHAPAPKRVFDFGKAAHAIVLGAGPELHVMSVDNYRTDAAKAERDDARKRGAVPLLAEEFDAVQAMAAALRRHPLAAEVFDPNGAPEVSLFWIDPETGVKCKARVDWLASDPVDVKTTVDISREHIAREVAAFGYHQQAPHYLDGCWELDLIPPGAVFRFVFLLKTPPYLPRFVELDDVALKIGAERNRLAREIFRDCTASGVWPTDSDDIDTVSLPAYVERRHYEET